MENSLQSYNESEAYERSVFRHVSDSFDSSLKRFSTVDNPVLLAMLGVEARAASLNLNGGIDCLADSRPVSCEMLSSPSSSSISFFLI